jgi:GDSL-like Lipase/Acylhydrolase family
LLRIIVLFAFFLITTAALGQAFVVSNYSVPSSNTPLVISNAGAYVIENQIVQPPPLTLQISDRTISGATYKLVCVGDSLTAVSIQAPGYCSDVVGLLASNRSVTATWKSFGMIGYSWNYTYSLGPWFTQTINSMLPDQVVSEIYPGLTNTFILWAGTNGMFLGSHTAAQEYTDFQTGYAVLKAAGISDTQIVVVTTLPRQDNSSFDTTRATYNADLKSFCTTNGCLIADAGGDATIGCNGCEDNATYYHSDKIHLTAAGDTYLATSLIYPVLP